MKKYGISYVKKDNHKDSINGYSLYTKFLMGWSEDHVEKKSKIPIKNIRSIWLINKP